MRKQSECFAHLFSPFSLRLPLFPAPPPSGQGAFFSPPPFCLTHSNKIRHHVAPGHPQVRGERGRGVWRAAKPPFCARVSVLHGSSPPAPPSTLPRFSPCAATRARGLHSTPRCRRQERGGDAAACVWGARAASDPGGQCRESGDGARRVLLCVVPHPPSPSSPPHRETGFDSDADTNPLMSMWRLHEGVSGASRAVDVAELHRLQKSSTKPRHDGERGGKRRVGGSTCVWCGQAGAESALCVFFRRAMPLCTLCTARPPCLGRLVPAHTARRCRARHEHSARGPTHRCGGSPTLTRPPSTLWMTRRGRGGGASARR